MFQSHFPFFSFQVQVLVGILAIPHEDFLSSWCSVNVPMIEEDASVDYEPFTAAGVALASLADGTGSALPTPAILNETNSSCANNFHGVPTVSYVQQRTSYLVKIIANLHCFVPNICEGLPFFLHQSAMSFFFFILYSVWSISLSHSTEEERDLFLNKFYECLLKENDSFSLYPSASDSWKASVICKNLGILNLFVAFMFSNFSVYLKLYVWNAGSLSNYAGSLIPNMLNADDVSLLRWALGVFCQNLFFYRNIVIAPSINWCLWYHEDPLILSNSFFSFIIFIFFLYVLGL